jgi:hypothetical protein
MEQPSNVVLFLDELPEFHRHSRLTKIQGHTTLPWLRVTGGAAAVSAVSAETHVTTSR